MLNNTAFPKTDMSVEKLNEIRKIWNSMKAEVGGRWCMPDECDSDRKLLTIAKLMKRYETRYHELIKRNNI